MVPIELAVQLGLFVMQSVFGSTVLLKNCGEFSTSKGQFIIIVENEPVGTILFNVRGIEAGNSFQVVDDTSHYIKAERKGSFGIVSLKKELDYEAGPKYEVTVNVVNIIEGNLTFSSSMYNVSVKEDVSQYSVILSNIQVSLDDPGDNGLNHLQFQVEESYLKYFFLQLDQNQPLRNTRLYKLKLQQQLNYSSESPYRFTAVASSPSSTPVTTSLTVQAIDQDTGINTTINYRLVQEIPSKGWFSVDKTSGAIKVINSPDRETCSQLTLFIKGYQVNNEALRYDVTWVDVTITDVDDNPPVIEKSVYNISIPENSPTGTNIVQVLATDKDEGNNAKFSFHFVTSNVLRSSCKGLGIDQATGMIKVQDSAGLDRERHPTLSCQVKAKGTHGKHLLREVKASDKDLAPAISYTITDKSLQTFLVNLKTGKITLNVSLTENFLKLYSFEIVASDGDKKAPRYTSIKATDKDPDDTLTYRITKSNSHFKINSTSGMLSLVKSLDYEVDHSHSINITVTDSVRNTMTTFSVTVLDINDNAPKFQNTSYIFTNVIEEDSNRNVGTVLATDIDGKGNNSEITYSIEPPWKANFSIGNGATDHELETRKDFHHIQVEDMDKTDINRQMTYSFIGSHDGFTIDPNSGNLSATKALEMEHTKNGQIELTISVSNNPTCKDNITVTQTIVINVQDINRFSPQFTPNTYSLNVKENYTVGSKLDGLRINATDRDTSPKYNTITYWIGNGDPSGHFYMDSKTAEIYLVKPLDYENLKQFVLTIHATDGHALYNGTSINATGHVTVKVQNVNDNTPGFNQDVYLCKFDENTQTSKNGCTVKATDGDKDKLSYRVNNTMFDINQSTRAITVKSGLDYDNGVHSYVLQVLATDNGSPKLTGTAVVEVDVLNLNDNTPSFSNKTYKFKVMEDAPVLTMVGVIQASDKDGDKLKYSIATANTGFSLDSDTGLLTLKSSLIDNTNITFTVQTTDSNKTDTAAVTVKVIDVNNHPPVFNQKVYNKDVAENVENVAVIKVQATDQDNSPGNKNISYSIGSPWNTNFTVDSKTGEVKVQGHLDRELVDDSGLITFVIMATDQGNPPLIGEAEIKVQVTDRNDNCPYYIDKEVTYIFKEYDQPVFHNFMVKDADKMKANRDCSYTFVPPLASLNMNFAISDSTHAYLEALTPFHIQSSATGIQQINHLTFTAKNFAKEGCSKKAIQTVLLVVQDVNDHTPEFQSKSYLFYVNEDTAGGSKINNVSIKAIDADPTEEFNTVHYGIESGDSQGHFSIDTLSGNIYIMKNLDYETTTNYNLKVTATDGKPFNNTGKVLTSTITVEIRVNDINDNPPVFDKGM
ncbi:Hypothetical predicted protein [Mytilus galloprovincialis]|uniref:Cadherin domain-containing protein n=1 Tax=Mytilus galloprovincialis TaxID=29158 RepID=A0A8B6G0W1_MYTGA|nr:Hypothetical predicted protein [Mytilus galloprovincialis]